MEETEKVLGIDIGGTSIKAAVVDTVRGVLLSERRITTTPKTMAPVIEAITQLIADFAWRGAIGCGFPGVVKSGVIHTAANLSQDWIGVDLGKELSRRTSGAVGVINDADAAGLAEMNFGVGRVRNRHGGGGALLREKILAQNSSRLIIIADQTKLSPDLGTKFRLPVEVIPFSLQPMQKYLVSIGAKPTLRIDENGQTFITDEGNFIIDCKFGAISKPYQLAQTLKTRAGLVEHGLFLNLATDVIVAGENGIQHFKARRL